MNPCGERPGPRRLHAVAHCRAGDKGDTSILSVFPYHARDYPLLVERLTAQRVGEHLGARVRGRVTRHLLPSLLAIQFVCERALDGGVTTSTALDTHGKALSFALLALDLDG